MEHNITPATTQGPESGNSTKETSFGLGAGCVLFIIIIIVIVYLRKKCQYDGKKGRSEGSTESSISERGYSEDNDSDDDNDDELSEVIDENLYMWRLISDNVKNTVKAHMVDVSALVMGTMLGKGEF